MVASADEPFTEYGLVAETVEVPADRSWVTFTLRPGARFHDGRAMTVEDVIWTFETLTAHGHPFYRTYYVARAEPAGPGAVRFTFTGGTNRELPLIVGQMPVLSKAWWTGRDFGSTTLSPRWAAGPIASSASTLDGRSRTAASPTTGPRGCRSTSAGSTSIGSGTTITATVRWRSRPSRAVSTTSGRETSAKDWATAYDVPAVREGHIKIEEIPHQLPTGMQGFVYNARRAVFADRRVRRALAQTFDFEWTSTYLFHGAYRRTESYFSNSDLPARGLPGPLEVETLAAFREQVAPEVFTEVYRAPSTKPGGLRPTCWRRCDSSKRRAGWSVTRGWCGRTPAGR